MYLLDVNPFRVSCEQVSDLVHALQNIVSVHNFRDDRIPKYLVGYLRKAIIGLARLSFVNSYVRIPPIVWKFGWDPTLEGIYSTELPPLPVEIMKEKDVLKEFVYRVNQIGMLISFNRTTVYYLMFQFPSFLLFFFLFPH